MTTTNKIQRAFTGVVISNKMAKTLVVAVERVVVHPKYGKRYMQSKKFHVHDEHGNHQVGEKVTFQASKPYSKTKRWRIVNV